MNTHNVFRAFLVSDKFEEIDEFNHDIDLDFDNNGIGSVHVLMMSVHIVLYFCQLYCIWFS